MPDTTVRKRPTENLPAPLKILLVGNEPAALAAIRATLESSGCQVKALADSIDAAENLWAQQFDGVFLDAELPHPNGFELAGCARASTLNARVPIVMFSRRDDGETMRKGFKAGATFFVNSDLLRDRLQTLVNAMRGTLLTERRRHRRAPCNATVEWSVDNSRFHGVAINVGESGMLFASPNNLEVGQSIEIEFTLPKDIGPLKVQAEVNRKEPPDHFAVEFVNMSSTDRSAIRRHVSASIGD